MADRALDYLFHHLFLPPRVPHTSDNQLLGDRAILEQLVQSAAQFRDIGDPRFYSQWSTLCRTLQAFATMHRNGSLSKLALRSSFCDLKDGDIIILHVAVQNSGLILRKVTNQYVIESFEASPPASKVLEATTALQWDFPSQAIAIPSTAFEDPLFQSSLAEFIERASVEPVKQFAATSLKAGAMAFESRDTASPAIIGQLLMAILEANGHKQNAKLTRKRVHDEVCWGDGAENPWRRSAAWLVLRVGMQRSLCFLLGGIIGTLHYKFFICFILASIAKELSVQSLCSADRLAFAGSKLARRVAKLQQQKDSATPQVAKAIDSLFLTYGKVFNGALELVNAKLAEMWASIRTRVTKTILPLPRRADSESTNLSLLHSRGILYRILDEMLYRKRPAQMQLQQRQRHVYEYSTWVHSQEISSVSDYLKLADSEIKLQNDARTLARSPPDDDLEEVSLGLFRNMQKYQGVALTAYKHHPEQLSLMLLTLLELWQALDTIAIDLYPILGDFDPGFPQNLLYPLQVSELTDMCRLQKLEKYIERRHSSARFPMSHVLGEMAHDSFAARYFDQCEEMQDLHGIINAADGELKGRKEFEWIQKSSEYEAILNEAARTACLFMEDEFDPLKRQHDDRRCRKHFLERKAARMRIQIHEALLPIDPATAKAVIFELRIPPGFATWRDATWQILQIGQRQQIPDRPPHVFLYDYPGLRSYMEPTGCGITLASRTKSFLNTHYAQVPFPTSLDQVCLTHGLKYGLYQHQSSVWTAGHLKNPSFAELCSPSLPGKSVYVSLRKYLHPNFEGTIPSGNEVVASQTRCPNTLSVAEYIAFQDLRLGAGVQWIRLLRELAASNLNFGTVEVGTLVAELALMAGLHEGNSALRANHWIFQDPSFCEALIAQIKRRLEGITANWREGQTAESLILLMQRLWSLSTSRESVRKAEELLLDARKMTRSWVTLLRQEIYNARDIETAQKRSADALLAALLCRKTFVIEAGGTLGAFQADQLACFLECAFTVKDNLAKNDATYISKMPVPIRKLFISDLKLVHRLETKLRSSIKQFPRAVTQAVNSVWAEAQGGSPRDFTEWKFLTSLYDGWVVATSIVVDGLLEQEVKFDVFEGTLMIDGQVLGRLPDEYTKQEFFQQLFGNRVFLTLPSTIRGMSYMLASLYKQHEIHFGFRDGAPILRTRCGGRTLEYIPAIVFLGNTRSNAPDLPFPLINGHVHWLDLFNRSVEIRPLGSMWQHRLDDWTINLYTNQAWRNKGLRNQSLLVDTRSQIFLRVATLIEPFENREKMVIYQPQQRNLSLHLPALELRFEVDQHGSLYSHQLRATIDSNQDAGTFYGIASSLILSDILVPEDRSIIVAMGIINIGQHGGHTSIRIEHTGYYARFFINRVLGRLDCPPEPRLIYFKAYCHALTTFVLPDPLTGRTGTDEAIHCLQAGNAQPWAPLDRQEDYLSLISIAELTPQRVYYPEKLKLLQRVIWRDDLLLAAQNDDFQLMVKGIMQQCTLLHPFHLGSAKPPVALRSSDEHLLRRALTRNNSYRAVCGQRAVEPPDDHTYTPRDYTQPKSCTNAFEAALLVKKWSPQIAVSHDLASILREWPMIQGFENSFEHHLFADLININLAANWGSLFKLCQESSETRDRFKLMFLFATISFDGAIDMSILRTLVAVSIVDQLKAVEVPLCPSFTQFHPRQKPTIGYLTQYMQPHRVPYPLDERALLTVAMHGKQRRKLEIAQNNHEQLSENSCNHLARSMLVQWPSRDIRLSESVELPLLNFSDALLAIQSEWTRLIDNHGLSTHLVAVQHLLNTLKPAATLASLSTLAEEQEFFSTPFLSSVRPTMQDLLGNLERPAGDNNASLTVTPITTSDTVQKMMGTSSTRARMPHMDIMPTKKPLTVTSGSNMGQFLNGSSPLISELRDLVRPLASGKDQVRRAYGLDLERSIAALEKSQIAITQAHPRTYDQIDVSGLESLISSSRASADVHFASMRNAMTEANKWLDAGRLLPDLTPVTLLESLSTVCGMKHLAAARDRIIRYGHLIMELQHLLRIQGARQRMDSIQLADEIQHVGHGGWEAKDHVEWFLLEIDFNLRIRPDQHEVAKAMITPSTNSNFVLQMNMGKGKSSVIIPMVVAQLANSKNLARVVVPRSLLQQTAQLLQARLGGLIGRKVRHVPFSRRSSTEIASLKAYHNIHVDVLQSRGVMLTLPEHVLSFQLSGLQELSNSHIQQADSMMKLQDWFARRCRDILDECDHMLAVKTQLIFPSGSQAMVDGHPTRWKVVQDLLKLVKLHIRQVRRTFPRSIEIIEKSRGTFPTIYLLSNDVKEALLSRLIDSVLKGESGMLPIDECSQDELGAVNSFLREAQFSKSVAMKVSRALHNKTDVRHRLLLLRGLLVHRILLMGLGKRWNVQYGIDPRRDPIAVPFRSKGIPSDQAEFGHPDVSIILTCLSFYYAGLTVLQFRQNLTQLLKSDEPTTEFESWIRDVPSFPDSLRSWSALNIDDEMQCLQLWDLLRQQMAVINHFLNYFVFPRHARTFERKLVSSGWDIAVMRASVTEVSSSGLSTKLKENIKPETVTAKSPMTTSTPLTVGFSGTNDNKTLLPLNVLQNDLPGLAHTNAEVLTYLLQPRNRAYYPACDKWGRRISERAFLHKLKDKGIRMLLDAGAQILELDNLSLAQAWLEVDTDAEAGVFFGEDGRARVVYKDGKQQPLAVSPFLSNLGACVVYLDEAHVRGVDLKMPANAVAALTLGIMQTKDHTVQAAMRLRQLGISQSVVFFAPPEVHQSIVNLRSKFKTSRNLIDSRDVIAWLLEQTCCNIEQLQPLYISQGMEYCRRRIAAYRFPNPASDSEQRKAFLQVLEQPEQYSLEKLYAPDQRVKGRPIDAGDFFEIAEYVNRLTAVKKGLRNTGDTVQALAHQEVEQEREVQIETETVREVKKPNHAQGLPQPPLAKEIRSFAETGRLVAGSQAYQQVFVALRHTALGRRLNISDAVTKSRLLVTQDFNDTVITQWGRPLDEYSRPVHWILWSTITDTALIVSDHEADGILPLIRNNSPPCTHLITYAAPVNRTMIVFDSLKFYSVPRLPDSWQAPTWLVRDLGIFGGRLYFDYESQCNAVYEFLGLPAQAITEVLHAVELTEMDLWRELPYEETVAEQQKQEPFSPNALLFMQAWLAIRRKGQDFSTTMMGEVCRGRRLEREETGKIEEFEDIEAIEKDNKM